MSDEVPEETRLQSLATFTRNPQFFIRWHQGNNQIVDGPRSNLPQKVRARPKTEYFCVDDVVQPPEPSFQPQPQVRRRNVILTIAVPLFGLAAGVAFGLLQGR